MVYVGLHFSVLLPLKLALDVSEGIPKLLMLWPLGSTEIFGPQLRCEVTLTYRCTQHITI